MAQISIEDITKLTDLALLEVTENEKVQLQNSINSILGYVGQITEASIGDVDSKYNFVDVSRKDISDVTVGSRDLIVQNMRQVSADGFVEVSKVINK